MWEFPIEAAGSGTKLATIKVAKAWPRHIMVEAAKQLQIPVWHLRLFVNHDFAEPILDKPWKKHVQTKHGPLKNRTVLSRVIQPIYSSTNGAPDVPPAIMAKYKKFARDNKLYSFGPKLPLAVFTNEKYPTIQWKKDTHILYYVHPEGIFKCYTGGIYIVMKQFLSQDIIYEVEANYPFRIIIGGMYTFTSQLESSKYKVVIPNGLNCSLLYSHQTEIIFATLPETASKDVKCRVLKGQNMITGLNMKPHIVECDGHKLLIQEGRSALY